MLRNRAYVNTSWYGDPKLFHSTALQIPGQLGRYAEDGYDYGGQLVQLVDGSAVDGDVVYYKTYDNGWTVTPTIGNSSAGEVAGVVTASVAANEYCFVRKIGTHSVKANGLFARGIEVMADSGSNRVVPWGFRARIALTAGTDTGGGILSWQSPYTHAIAINYFAIDLTTAATAACTADAGTTATSATTSSDNLVDGVDLNTAIGYFDNLINPGTNGKHMQPLAAGKWITISRASGASAGLAGFAHFEFIHRAAISLQRLGIANDVISGGKVSMELNIPYV